MTAEPGPQEHDLDQRLDEEREQGTVHRPTQAPALENADQSVAEERRATQDDAPEGDT